MGKFDAKSNDRRIGGNLTQIAYLGRITEVRQDTARYK